MCNRPPRAWTGRLFLDSHRRNDGESGKERRVGGVGLDQLDADREALGDLHVVSRGVSGGSNDSDKPVPGLKPATRPLNTRFGYAST